MDIHIPSRDEKASEQPGIQKLNDKGQVVFRYYDGEGRGTARAAIERAIVTVSISPRKECNF